MFIKENTAFPPKSWEFWYKKYMEYSSWYSGDIQQLLDYYTIDAIGSETAQERFWARIEREERASVVHLPIAGDVAMTSSNLLFGEKARINYNDDDFVKEFLEENGFDNVLLEASELGAAMSGCFLKLDIETQLSNVPLVSIMTPSQCFPTFWRGRLWSILFYRTVKESEDGFRIWRLFESRERSGNDLLIEYKLYKGTADKIGHEVDFESIEETANLNLQDIRYNNINGLGCVYIPNMRPNKLCPGSHLGMNDFGSSISLMDSLDFTWTSWIRDIELGMSQIFIDEELLVKVQETSTGTMTFLDKFSKFKKAFTKINLSDWRMGGDTTAKPIDHLQFNIRVDEHSKTCNELSCQIINNCGYSLETFGFGNYGQAESGKALRIREHKSQLTREKKSRYWIQAIKELIIQAQKLMTSSIEENISVEIEDSIITDKNELSESIRNLDQARAISTYQKVLLQHTDWGIEEIEKEVQRINNENGSVKNPFDDNDEIDNNNVIELNDVK